jgi:hypothetical protein
MEFFFNIYISFMVLCISVWYALEGIDMPSSGPNVKCKCFRNLFYPTLIVFSSCIYLLEIVSVRRLCNELIAKSKCCGRSFLVRFPYVL